MGRSEADSKVSAVTKSEDEPFVEVVSLGSLCAAAAWLRNHNLRNAAFPFDWVFSSPAVVRHCLRDDFHTFLDRDQYFSAGESGGIGHRVYSSMLTGARKNVFWRHHNPLHQIRDYELMRRCVGRLRSTLRRSRARRLFILFQLVQSSTALDLVHTDVDGQRQETGPQVSWTFGSDFEIRGLFNDLIEQGVQRFHFDVVRLCCGSASEAKSRPKVVSRIKASNGSSSGESLAVHELHMVGGHTGLKFKDARDEAALVSLLVGSGSSARQFALKPSSFLRSLPSSRLSLSQKRRCPLAKQANGLYGDGFESSGGLGKLEMAAAIVVGDDSDEEPRSPTPVCKTQMGSALSVAQQATPLAESRRTSAPKRRRIVGKTPKSSVGHSNTMRRTSGLRRSGQFRLSAQNPINELPRSVAAEDRQISKGVSEMPHAQPSAAHSMIQELGLTVRPEQMGCRVTVRGDGWGGGQGNFDGVVTEADNHTFTVIGVGSDGVWQEKHVLREHCVLLDQGAC